MSRQATGTAKKYLALLLTALMLSTGCHPTQPFYLHEDGDLSHYIDAATNIDYPDVDQLALAEAEGTKEPLTIINPHFDEFWDLTLEEAICLALKNSKVMRTLGIGGGSGSRAGQGVATFTPDRLLSAPEAVPTVYDPALTESQPGSVGLGRGVLNPLGGRFSHPNDSIPGRVGTGAEAGVEAALSAFDVYLDAGMFWDRQNRPRNFAGGATQFFSPILKQHSWNNWVQLSKRTAAGTELYARTRADYTFSNSGIGGEDNPATSPDESQFTRPVPSDWLATLELEARQPLLQGAGTQVNRMNVMVARINTDQSLADFELAVRNLVSDVEWAYWDLYFQYRNLDAQKAGRDSALVSWKKVKTKAIVSVPGGEAEKEAQARQQYFRFRSQVETALQTVFTTENRLRYVMGLTATDGRMIRPADEPVTAAVRFDWRQILCEALHRSPELRKQKWRIKRREMELILARNDLLPRLDAVALYRWLGVGDDLIQANRNTGVGFPGEQRGDPLAVPPDFFPGWGSQAWDEMTEGKYQEFSFGVQFQMPIGFRQQLAGVRWAQLGMARERARHEDMELELSHALTGAYQEVEAFYQNVQTNHNWRVAAQKEVDAVQAAYDAGTQTLDLLLRAQQSRSDAEVAYYNSLKEYTLAIARVHFRKGSLLEYNNVCLAEGPWPGKAYFDAMGHARRRDASYYLDYGYTRPRVMSRGEVEQFQSNRFPSSPDDSLTPGGTRAPLEEIERGAETLEVPPEPETNEMDMGGTPLRAPARTATLPDGPELAPPLLKSAGGPGRHDSFDWGFMEKQLGSVPTEPPRPAPIVPASYVAGPEKSVMLQVPRPAAGTSLKLRPSPPQPPEPATAANASGWRAQ